MSSSPCLPFHTVGNVRPLVNNPESCNLSPNADQPASLLSWPFLGNELKPGSMQVQGSEAMSVLAELQRYAFHTHISKAKAEAGSPEWPVKAAARSTLTAPETRLEGPGALSPAPCCGQLPDAVVSERVPASREEELGAWPDSPRLCRPRALLLLPGKQVESEHNIPSRRHPQRCFGHLLPSGV